MDFYFPLIWVRLSRIFESCFSHLQWEQGMLLGSSGGHCGCPHSCQRKMGGHGGRQEATEAQPLPFLGVSYSEDL